MKKHISINTSKRQQKVLAVAIVSMFLSACGGGGGSNGTVPTTTTAPTTTTTPPTDTISTPPTADTTPTTPTTFTSWSAVADGSTVAVPGMSQEVTQTTVAGKVTGIGTPTPVYTNASSFTETLSSNGTITNVVIASRTGSVTFDIATGDKIGHLNIDPTISAALKSDQSSFALAADPNTQGWEYQSFGVWSTGRVAGSGNAGVMSIGAPTAVASIPTSGTATFTGKSIGFYTDATGTGHAAFSDLSVDANFALRTLDLSSTGTVKTNDYQTTPIPPASNLNLSGTLTYAAGADSFAGTLTTAGGTLTGTSTGRFYGPNAEELGGVFILKAGSGIETYGGAYGAKRGAIAP